VRGGADPGILGSDRPHRLNRGGDRHANNALWRIALVRMRCHPPTRAYVERRTKQGLSKLDIMRCLKRYIAREVYHQLTSPPAIAPTACPKEEASTLRTGRRAILRVVRVLRCVVITRAAADVPRKYAQSVTTLSVIAVRSSDLLTIC
jgi:Transposase IS116/IS110/IS902 family